MQSSNKPAIQIHVRGTGMIQLHFAGRCVGFATSYRAAGFEADRLDHLFSAIQKHDRNFPSNLTGGNEFGSVASDFAAEDKPGFLPEAWLVEAGDGTPVRLLPSEEAAELFRNALEAYDSAMPQGGQDGEWTDAQISWYRNHPAPIASACGGAFSVRKVGVH